MKDHRIIELLSRKISGEISALELIELEDLMARYSDAIYYEEILRQIWERPEEQSDLSDAYERHKSRHAGKFNFNEEGPEDQAEQLETADMEEEPAGRKWSSYKIPVLFTLLLVLAAALLFYHPDANEELMADTEIISGKGIRKNITLPDGTNVWLNSESRLLYDKTMVNRDERIIRLSGEAFFDVKHDKKHPFIIHTNKISIKVLGTSFNVRAYENDDRTETTLIKGSVELSVNSRPKEKIILKPSEKFILNEQSGSADPEPSKMKGAKMIIEYVAPVIVASKEYVRETSWTDNCLVFKNESMEELVPKLERWYNVNITIKDPKIKKYRYTGVFSKESIDQALLAMQLTKYYNFKIQNHDIEIY